MINTTAGTLTIIAAPSGAGKTTLVGHLVNQVEHIEVSISHTTRPQRPGEVDGHNYFFIDQATYDDMVAQQAFLEYATVYGKSYGTSKEWVQDKLNQGIDVILEIDWQGAKQVRQLLPQCPSVFILPPSLETLQQRLLDRGQDAAAIIEQRMAQAQSEMSHCHEFDYLLVNDNFDATLQDLISIIKANRLRQTKQAQRYADLIGDLLAHC